jgi:hypothetical protein
MRSPAMRIGASQILRVHLHVIERSPVRQLRRLRWGHFRRTNNTPVSAVQPRGGLTPAARVSQ